MGASTDDITMDAAFALHSPSPLSVFNVPAYTITGYGAEIDGWMLTNMDSQAPAFTSTISANMGRQFDSKSFGHSDAGGSDSFDMGVFSIGGGGGSSTDESSFQFGQWADEITLTLTVNFAQTMTISPGEWYVCPAPLWSTPETNPALTGTSTSRTLSPRWASSPRHLSRPESGPPRLSLPAESVSR